MAAVILAIAAISYQGIKAQQKKHNEKKRLEQEALENAPPPPYGADNELIKHHSPRESLRQKAARKLNRGKKNSVAGGEQVGEASTSMRRRGSEATLVEESDYENGRRGSSLDKERAAI